MKKFVFAIALMASLLASATDDSYLYWMVDVTETAWHYDYSVQVRGKTSDSDVGSLLNLYYGDGASADKSIGSDYLKDLSGSDLGFYAKLASDVTYTSYVFELFCDSGVVAQSDPYADVQAFIVTGGIGAPKLSPMAVQMALPAPEPSSGLLLLLGVAGLALRRRKQITA